MERSEQFFVPLKANKLRTFSTPMKTKSKSGSEISLRTDRKFMTRMLIIAQNIGLDMRTVLSHSLSPVSMPLSSDDASLSKTNKVDLLHALESTVPDCLVEKLTEGALIIDFMGLVHSMKNIYDTFGSLADGVLNRVLELAHRFKSSHVDLVADTYPTISIKNYERRQRGSGGGQIVKIFDKDR